MLRFTFNSNKPGIFKDEELLVSQYARDEIMAAIDFAVDVAREYGTSVVVNNGHFKIAIVKRSGTVLFKSEKGYFAEQYKKGLEIRAKYDKEWEENENDTMGTAPK